MALILAVRVRFTWTFGELVVPVSIGTQRQRNDCAKVVISEGSDKERVPLAIRSKTTPSLESGDHLMRHAPILSSKALEHDL